MSVSQTRVKNGILCRTERIFGAFAAAKGRTLRLERYLLQKRIKGSNR